MTKKTYLLVLLALMVYPSALWSASGTTAPAKSAPKVKETPSASRKAAKMKHSRRGRHHRRYYERFYTSSFTDDPAAGDVTAGEDPRVRAAALDALGGMNGTVVAIDPASGRILSMVNQKLALSGGATPCSTIKVSVALAALQEKIITRDTQVRLRRRVTMDLTEALAHSNNTYFEVLGRRLGFARVHRYAKTFGLGELAGYNIEGETLGSYPDKPISSKDGGVGRMCSYGDGINMTPLQLGALVSAIANGGTLYYLQHPRSEEESAALAPRVKRQLKIAPYIPDVNEGMEAAVDRGTARSVRYSFNEEDVMGKTGTCSKDGTRYGWFASYAESEHGKLVVVVFLQGGRPTFGPKAAEIAGRVYRNLYDHNFFDEPAHPATEPAGISQ